MVRKLRFHRSVPDDLVNALDYYEAVSQELANRFRNSVDRRLDQIAENPNLFPSDVDDVRFARLDRFPYIIFFRIESDHVRIVAILHGASHPDKWRLRD